MSPCDTTKTDSNLGDLNKVCKTPKINTPDFSKAPTESELDSIMRLLNIQSCKSAAGGGVSLLPPIIGGATLQSGCETIQVVNASYQACMKAVQCVINQMQNQDKQCLLTVNTIYIEIGKGAKIKGDINAKQVNGLSLVSANQFTNKVTTHLSNNIATEMKSMFNQFSKMKTGYLGTPQGQKQISNINKQITQDVLQKQINSSINQSTINIKTSNKYTLILNSQAEYEGIQNITQTNIVNLLTSNIVGNSFSSVFDNTLISKFFDDFKQHEEQDNAGIGELALGGGLLFIVLIIGGFLMFGGTFVNNIIKYVVPLALIILLIMTVIFILTKNTMSAIICGIATGIILIYQVLIIFKHKKGTVAKFGKSYKYGRFYR
jgi:hypothetical protein